MSPPRHKWTTTQLATMRQMHRAGRSDEEIAQALGVTAGAVRQKRSTLGIVKVVRAGAGLPKVRA